MALAEWLEKEAECFWAVAANEEDKLRARRMLECSADLKRFYRMKIRFRDQLSPPREQQPVAAKDEGEYDERISRAIIEAKAKYGPNFWPKLMELARNAKAEPEPKHPDTVRLERACSYVLKEWQGGRLNGPQKADLIEIIKSIPMSAKPSEEKGQS
jgi:hypothetical protein